MSYANEFPHDGSSKGCHLLKWFHMIIILLRLLEIAPAQTKW